MQSKQDYGTPSNGRERPMSNRNRWIAGGVFLLALGVTWALTAHAQPPRSAAVAGTLKGQIAAATKLEEADVDKVLKELGPAISARLARGEQVNLPGLGTFRVVRIPEHKDLVQGRPATIPAVNHVEFMAGAAVLDASNAPTAVPAAVVPAFEYNPVPYQTPGQRVPEGKVPSTRIR
jgi:nucleoid DNA-binding protein